ncbi:hypothetical protein PHET_08977 [Paragonimus heterotremus]|uniref:SH3 domain-containing protein n=1 Tax=Paragonimus heterotremus TaxID=100268 RepID=A0A8J4T3P2_9TREM|nr:hypothetical protein PHET_08977 [Paragonimus heterotremus]
MHRGRPDGQAVAHDSDTRRPDPGHTLANEHSQIAFVLYDYQAQRSDELTVERGSRVKLLHKDTPKWWMVKSLDSEKEGYVPANYLSNDQDFTHKDTEKNRLRTDLGKQAVQLTMDDNCLGPRTRAGIVRAVGDRITELVRLHECDQKQVVNCTIQATVENTPSSSQTPSLPLEIKTSNDSQSEPYLKKTVARKSRPLPEGDDAVQQAIETFAQIRFLGVCHNFRFCCLKSNGRYLLTQHIPFDGHFTQTLAVHQTVFLKFIRQLPI